MTSTKSAHSGRLAERVPARAMVAGGVIAGALVPAAVAAALLVSVGLRRPLLAPALERHRAVSGARLTIAWALALVGIAVAQAAGAVLGFGSITSGAGLAARTGFGLAVEAVLLVATVAYVAVPSQSAR